jgi:hypothetical protein
MSWVQARPRQAVEREYHGPTDQDRCRWSVPIRWVLAWGHATRAEVARSVRGQGFYSYVACLCSHDSSQRLGRFNRPPEIASPWFTEVMQEATICADSGSDFHWKKPSLNLLPQCFCVAGEVVMSHHVRPPRYAWGYDWPDDCPPPYYGRVRFTNPPAAHARVAGHLPPCQPHAGINTDWSGDKCAVLHKSSSYALLPAPPAQSQASQPTPSAQPQASQPAPPRLRNLRRTRSP